MNLKLNIKFEKIIYKINEQVQHSSTRNRKPLQLGRSHGIPLRNFLFYHRMNFNTQLKNKISGHYKKTHSNKISGNSKVLIFKMKGKIFAL